MSQQVTYHLLTHETVHLLSRLDDVFDNAIDAKQLDAFLNDPGHVMYLAVENDTVVGMASGTVLFHPDKPPALFVNELGVAPTSRRRGIATALFGCLRNWAEDAGCGPVWLATEGDNDAALGLYRALHGEVTQDVVVFTWN